MPFTSQLTLAYNRNRENATRTTTRTTLSSGRRRSVAVPAASFGYIGYNGDGHFGRMNLTTSITMQSRGNTGRFAGKVDTRAVRCGRAVDGLRLDPPRIRCSTAAATTIRLTTRDRLDAIFENPQFAGPTIATGFARPSR